MNRLKKSIAFFVFAAAICLSTAVFADTITVDKGGKGDYTSIQSAVDAASPGDTVLVKKGIYYETVTITKKGTKEKPITVRAESNGLGDVIVTAADEEIRTGKRKWTLLEGTEDVYYIDWDKKAGSVTVDGLFFIHCITLEQLKTREYNSRCIGFPSLGYYWEGTEKRLYIRLHENYFDSLDPNDHTVCVGGEAFEYADDAGTLKLGAHQTLRKNTDCYNIAVWTEGETFVNIEGFTLETPGTCGIYVRGDDVTVRNCWFRGCRVGVAGSRSYYTDPVCSKNVVVEHCDFTQYPMMYSDVELVKKLHEDPEIMAREKETNYHWGAKNKAVRYDYETAGFVHGAGYNWEVCNNYTWETFEPLDQRFHSYGMELVEVDGVIRDTWISGSNLKVHHNRFEKSVDNVLEFESHGTDIDFYNNECIDVLQAISWQPMDGPPLPKNGFIHHNLFYSTEDHVRIWGAGSPFKLGMAKEQMDSSWWNLQGIWRQPGDTYFGNRHWFVDDKGLWIYNNTVVMPKGQAFFNLGSWDRDDRHIGAPEGFSTGLGFYNNVFYTKMLTENPGYFMKEAYSINQNTNIFISGEPTETEINRESKWLKTGMAFTNIEEAGLSLKERDGIKVIEIEKSNSPAADGGTQVEWSVKDTPYIGAVPYGEEWKIYYGVYPYGDVNYDRIVDEADLLAAAEKLNTKRGDDDFSNCADLDFNNVIDNADLQLLSDVLAGGVAE